MGNACGLVSPRGLSAQGSQLKGRLSCLLLLVARCLVSSRLVHKPSAAPLPSHIVAQSCFCSTTTDPCGHSRPIKTSQFPVRRERLAWSALISKTYCPARGGWSMSQKPRRISSKRLPRERFGIWGRSRADEIVFSSFAAV
jgi:hypothetical protein